ncbi:sensor histidine kinase KdpD [Acinetobacter sp. VNK23]|uniref:sensor histidine kinase n=1 Tax=Acinetobacter thutiue TaxID=2998078 RepID=UPI002578CC2B|nr:sensor histidine kinase KdpD [Acinetobacter thutiue]MDM1020396.1 sensor histidine kinase KdpD [Acinetobacter thutiue]
MTIDRNSKADAWLAHSQREQSGRLTLFLGAAPGVGKTYAMLSRAHELVRQGHHVVVGIVETHGRIETEQLVEGLQVLPRKRIQYQNRSLEEMDLDQILSLKPEIVLVDELAHRNVPNSRHEYRWQDVNEILDAGIDVYSTLNIQHLESLNDVVYQITGVRVSETVPDLIFKRLKDVRLVDLPVPELLERMKQGKIYMPEQTVHALDGFFKPVNLIALRDLAIQTVAGQVDLNYREKFTTQGQVIPVQNHLMLVIDGSEFSEDLVRRANRIAERRNALWSVISVQKSRQKQQRILMVNKAFQLARKLGAETYLFYNDHVAESIIQAAYDYGASNILICYQPKKTRWKNLFNQSITNKLLAEPHPFEITLVQPSSLKNKGMASPSHQNKREFNSQIRQWLESSIIVCLGLTIATVSDKFIGYNDLALIFIITVMLVAIRTEMLMTFVSVLVCFALYNYFFISPRFSFEINAKNGVITIVIFLVSALLVGRLASLLKAQVVSLKSANSVSIQLLELERKLSPCVDLSQVVHVAKQHLETVLNAQVWLKIGEKYTTLNVALNEKEQIAADWTQKNLQPCGRFTNTLTQSDWWFNPLILEKQHGVIGIKFPASQNMISFEQQRLIELMIEDIAQTASRIQLATELEDARVVGETEKLRSALLSSVSHDLRSPLAAIIGSADSLKYYAEHMSKHDQNELLDTIHIEGERLDRYIQNLLDMTRLGHQGLTLARDWIEVDTLIQSATERLIRYQPHIKIQKNIAPNLPQLYVHPALVEQAIFNVLENAAKFSPDNTPMQITAVQDGNFIQIDIIDEGIGIPEQEREQIFNMFYTMQRGDRGKTGTGLGLSIVKAIIGAHMGEIQALAAFQNYGTLIRIRLPLNLSE